MKILKQLFVIFTIIISTKFSSLGQANPFINVLPSNFGIVATGGTIDIEVTIGNTGPSSTIAQAKLRPIIQVPASVTFLPNAQQTGLPVGWTILSNSGSQLRLCNSTDPIPVNTSRTIILKVQAGNVVTAAQTFAGNINFGNGTNCAAGTSVAGDLTTDNSALSTIEVVSPCNLGVTATAGTIVCNGGSTNITCSVTGATGAVEYNISGNPNWQSSTIFTVPAGTYTITARDSINPNSCITSTNIVITEPNAVPLTNSIIHPTCTNSLGIVSITSNTLGLTFSVDGGAFTSYPTTGYLLSSGAHSIVAKNADNCSSAITNFTINAQPPTPLTPTIDSVTQPTCTVSTGSVHLSNLPAGQWTINPGSVSGNTTSTSINNLADGSYSFNVTNSFGCTSSNAASITINTVANAPIAPLVNITQPTCTVSTGSVLITSDTTGLTFSLDGGPFSAYPVGGYTGIVTGTHSLIAAQALGGCLSPFTYITIDAQPLSPALPILSITQPTCTKATGEIVVVSNTTALKFSFDGAPYSSYPANGFIANAGVHTLAVENLSGCAPTIVNNIEINPQPQTPNISASATPITCFGDISTITATASGGVLPYEFSINDTLFLSTNIFTVLAGNYRITVRDSNGCSNKTDTIFLTQPLPITGTVVATPILCNGDSSIVTISASGGVGAYEYSLNNDLYQNSNIFLVPAGNYTVDIRLINNPSCYATTNPTINIIQPEKLKIVAAYDAIKYCGDSTMINISASGGKPPYIGLGEFIKGPGVWTFTVVDSNGCSVTSDITLMPPGCLELNVYPNPAQNSISIDHSAAITSGAYFQILTESGAKIMSQKVKENSYFNTIDISALAKGVYLLVYINGKEIKVAKFTKVGM
jgi:hypothetical protein